MQVLAESVFVDIDDEKATNTGSFLDDRWKERGDIAS